MEPERYYIPKRKHWDHWVDVLYCKNCGQVRGVARFVAQPGTGSMKIEADDDKWEAACPSCGKTCAPSKGTGGLTYNHVANGVACFHSYRQWWNPWAAIGYWELHPKTAHKINPLSPIEMLAATLEGDDT